MCVMRLENYSFRRQRGNVGRHSLGLVVAIKGEVIVSSVVLEDENDVRFAPCEIVIHGRRQGQRQRQQSGNQHSNRSKYWPVVVTNGVGKEVLVRVTVATVPVSHRSVVHVPV